MNPRYLVTAALLPLTAAALALAPVLQGVFPGSAAVDDAPVVGLGNGSVPPLTVQPSSSEDGSVHLTIEPDRSSLYARGDRQMRVRMELWADGEGTTLPSDILLVIDRSGSMAGGKMLDAKAAASELASQLGGSDRLGIVSFASDARVDFPLAPVSPSAYVAIGGLFEGGGTEMGMGLFEGITQLKATTGRSTRMILISDGQPNHDTGLVSLAARSAQMEIPLSTIGIGDDYNEALMQQLADAGSGNFHWTTRGPELASVLSGELSTARSTVAESVALSVSKPDVRLVDVAGLPVVDGTAQLGTLFAGQHRTLWLTLEVAAGTRAETLDLGTLRLAYHTPNGLSNSVTAAMGSVLVTDDVAVATASLDDRWANGVVQDEYSGLRTAVAAAVAQGNKDAALSVVRDYELRNGSLNELAKNPIIDNNLAEVQQLKREVEQQFVGDDQTGRQNLWSKSTRKSSYDTRRQGQIKK